jgi:hypothetical protein
MKSEMNNAAASNTKMGQFPDSKACGFHSLPKNRIPHKKAVK